MTLEWTLEREDFSGNKKWVGGLSSQRDLKFIYKWKKIKVRDDSRASK